ncbi:hypothetical protein ACTJK5_01455 [Agrobacterium sp. 22094]|uniref:hypothetical protein n=1 Tax=Agrobacterium TaxID=357 RepID=UPI0028ABB539|nr:hypothetical protein [Agrobacterium cavarae]
MDEAQRAAEIKKIFDALDELIVDAAEKERSDWEANHGYAVALASIVNKFKSTPVSSATVNALNFEIDYLFREHFDVVSEGIISTEGGPFPQGNLKDRLRAIQQHLSYLDQENIIFYLSDPEITLPPDQSIAPYQFKVTETEISLVEQINHPKDGSGPIAEAALRVLLRMAENIREDLGNSNHPQILRDFVPLHTSLVEGRAVIETGMNASMFETQVAARSDELSGGLHATLTEFARMALNYVAQFNDWQLYIDNVAQTRISEEDSKTFARIAKAMAENLSTQPAVDPRVIEALTTAGEWGEKINTPKGRVSVAKTVLNIVAGFYNFVVRTPLKEIASAVVKSSIIIVLNYAMSNWGLMFNVPDGSWLYQAAEFIRQRLQELK